MKNKNSKIFLITAIAGTFAAIAATIVALIKHFKYKKSDNDEVETETADENNINDLDISSFNNDTPRQYVSISINEHNDGDNEISKL